MRQFGFNLKGSLSPPPRPDGQSSRILRRRLEDDVEDVFDKACAARDVERASDLLTVLEKMQARRAASYGRERRMNSGTLVRARQRLKQLSGSIVGS